MSENELNIPMQYNHPTVFRWNIGDDYYKDGVTIYSDGLCEINVGGYVIGRKLRGWFELEKELEAARGENKKYRDGLEKIIETRKRTDPCAKLILMGRIAREALEGTGDE